MKMFLRNIFLLDQVCWSDLNVHWLQCMLPPGEYRWMCTWSDLRKTVEQKSNGSNISWGCCLCRQSRMQTTGFSMFVDGGRGTRVGSDGSGLSNVWRQQLMQFKNVSVEVSNAILAHYPSPQLLRDVRFICRYCVISADEISLLWQWSVVDYYYVVVILSQTVLKWVNLSLIRIFPPYYSITILVFWEQMFWIG